jgi:MoaA/NifB/PqqE/SkfB family radical SAM enzyme
VNVLLNNYCNQRCPYCFAAEHLTSGLMKEISRQSFETVLAFLERSGYRRIQIGGGEPTLHPQFADLVSDALEREFSVAVLTNGLFNRRTRGFLKERQQQLRLLFNINDPSQYSPGKWLRLKGNLATLAGGETFFGVNVHHPDQSLDFMYDLCAELRPPFLRYVFAHNVGGYYSDAFTDPTSVRSMSRQIVELTRRVGDDLGIRCNFDCGFVPCLFSEAELGVLLAYNVYLGDCGVCPVVDTDLRVTHCFFHEEGDDGAYLRQFKDLSQVAAFLRGVKAKHVNSHLFDQCSRCASLALGSCDGGCLGDRIARVSQSNSGSSSVRSMT